MTTDTTPSTAPSAPEPAAQSRFSFAAVLQSFGPAIILLALGFNLVGDALRDILDPTQKGRY